MATTTELTDDERVQLRDLRGEILLAMGDADPDRAVERLAAVFALVGDIVQAVRDRQHRQQSQQRQLF